MRLDIYSLQKIALFAGISEEDLPAVLRALDARARSYSVGQNVMLSGDAPQWIGVVLDGVVHVRTLDSTGWEYTIGRIGIGGIFGESIVCSKVESSPVDALAAEISEVLFLRFTPEIALRTEEPFRLLVWNLMRLLAAKNVYLNTRLGIVTRRTTREKLLAYLRWQSGEEMGGGWFTVPLTRQQLAETLGVERSAMCAELSRMARDGLLEYRRSEFHLL